MTGWILGLAAFGLFFLYDWNRVFWRRAWMKPCFTAGCLLLVALGAGFLRDALARGLSVRLLWLAPGAVSLWALIYALFFALPFDDTYRQDAGNRKVCRAGIYGKSRHPGILAFFFCFLFLGLAAGERQLAQGMFYSALNLLYAWYQDRVIFVREFSDYDRYREEVPFLLPLGRKAGWN